MLTELCPVVYPFLFFVAASGQPWFLHSSRLSHSISLIFIFLRLDSFLSFYCCFYWNASLCFICFHYISRFWNNIFIFYCQIHINHICFCVGQQIFAISFWHFFSNNKNAKFYFQILMYCFRTYEICKSYIMPLFVYFQLKYIHKYIHTYTQMCICIFAQNIRSVFSFFLSLLCVTSRAP